MDKCKICGSNDIIERRVKLFNELRLQPKTIRCFECGYLNVYYPIKIKKERNINDLYSSN